MSYQLIHDALHVLKGAFASAHPSKPSKGFLQAELAKIKALIDGLPDDAPPVTAAGPVQVVGSVTAASVSDKSSPAASSNAAPLSPTTSPGK